MRYQFRRLLLRGITEKNSNMLLDFFTYDFLTRALIAGLVIGAVAPILGMFLTVRRYSLIADTLSHASLAGVAIGIILGMNPILSAIVISILVAIGIEKLRLSGKFGGEAILALFLSGSLAFAVVAMSAVGKFNGGVLAYLFGSITTVSSGDLWIIGGLSVGIVGIVWKMYPQFFLLSFDEDVAKVNGVNVGASSMVLAILTASMVAVSMRVVGILLVGALMVIPVLAAMQFRKGFKTTIGIAIVVSLLSVVSGLVLSYSYNLATGGTIVLCAVACFILSTISSSFRFPSVS